jgi:hypothetical protein
MNPYLAVIIVTICLILIEKLCTRIDRLHYQQFMERIKRMVDSI